MKTNYEMDFKRIKKLRFFKSMTKASIKMTSFDGEKKQTECLALTIGSHIGVLDIAT